MYYKSFRVINFRGISEVYLDLSHNRILTLVGLNESGKSTILTSVDLFYKLIKGNTPDEKNLNSFRPKGIDFTGSIEIGSELVFEDSDIKKLNDYLKTKNIPKTLIFPKEFSYQINFEYKLHNYLATKTESGFKIHVKEDNAFLFDSDNALWQDLISFVKKNLIPEILFYEDFIFDIPEKIIFSKNNALPPELDSQKNKEWQLVLNDILKSVNFDFTSFQQDVVSIWDKDNDTANNRISKMERALNNKITTAWKELFKVKNRGKSNQRLNFKEIKLYCVPEGNNINVTFKVKTDTDKEFLISERSKGSKWFFSFIIFTEFRKKRTNNILFLLDEPASNLHSSAQLKILEAINELSNGSMVIYSTHSHHLINPKWLAGAYVVINESISEENLEGNMTTDDTAKINVEKYFTYIGKGYGSTKFSYFQPILDRLDYAPSEVEPIPNITITEGKNDWYTFKYFTDVIFKDKYSYNFYPGAGCPQHWDIIRLYLSWGHHFILILDGDDTGLKTESDYKKEFSGFVENKIFTLKEVFGVKMETEDLFSERDKEKICDTVFGKDTYSLIKSSASKIKSSFNSAINQLLIKKRFIQLEKQTIDNFKKLLSFIQDKHKTS